jgi:cytochrome c
MSACRVEVDQIIAALGVTDIAPAKREAAYRIRCGDDRPVDGIELKPITTLRVPVTAVLDPAFAAVAKEKACYSCHADDKRLVGPSFADIARRYRTYPDAATKLTKKIMRGGSGSWGQIPMPPNPVSEAEARMLARDILAR